MKRIHPIVCFLMSLLLIYFMGSGWKAMAASDKEGEKFSASSSKTVKRETEPWFKTRGIVAGWNDVCNPELIDYISLAKTNGINTFSIFGANRESEEWKEFVRQCGKVGIELEYEEHQMSFLLPRALFNSHPEYFRMDEKGQRVSDANGCPSSEGALAEVRRNTAILAKNYVPTNNRYYFWFDDGGGICHCDKCKGLNYADQALLFENEIIKVLQKINPEAMLAHLCYPGAEEAPQKIKPHPDIFLEFAPFYRNLLRPLREKSAVGKYGVTHGEYLKTLEEHLKVFPAETAQVLEYWMDDSLFSEWNPNDLKEVEWNLDIFRKDLDTYASFGIRHIVCYSVYVGPAYVKKFGYPRFLEEYGKGLLNYKNKE